MTRLEELKQIGSAFMIVIDTLQKSPVAQGQLPNVTTTVMYLDSLLKVIVDEIKHEEEINANANQVESRDAETIEATSDLHSSEEVVDGV